MAAELWPTSASLARAEHIAHASLSQLATARSLTRSNSLTLLVTSFAPKLSVRAAMSMSFARMSVLCRPRSVRSRP